MLPSRNSPYFYLLIGLLVFIIISASFFIVMKFEIGKDLEVVYDAKRAESAEECKSLCSSIGEDKYTFYEGLIASCLCRERVETPYCKEDNTPREIDTCLDRLAEKNYDTTICTYILYPGENSMCYKRIKVMWESDLRNILTSLFIIIMFIALLCYGFFGLGFGFNTLIKRLHWSLVFISLLSLLSSFYFSIGMGFSSPPKLKMLAFITSGYSHIFLAIEGGLIFPIFNLMRVGVLSLVILSLALLTAYYFIKRNNINYKLMYFIWIACIIVYILSTLILKLFMTIHLD